MNKRNTPPEHNAVLDQAYREHTVARAVADLRLVDAVLQHDFDTERQFISADEPAAALFPNRNYRVYPNIATKKGVDAYKGFWVDEAIDSGGARNVLHVVSGAEPNITLTYQEFMTGTTTVDYDGVQDTITLDQISRSDYQVELLTSRSNAALALLGTTAEQRQRHADHVARQGMKWLRVVAF